MLVLIDPFAHLKLTRTMIWHFMKMWSALIVHLMFSLGFCVFRRQDLRSRMAARDVLPGLALAAFATLLPTVGRQPDRIAATIGQPARSAHPRQ
jgi:hypothetical protein